MTKSCRSSPIKNGDSPRQDWLLNLTHNTNTLSRESLTKTKEYGYNLALADSKQNTKSFKTVQT